jgi:hypothetical protein
MKRFSYWETKYFMPFWDVVIVGSGITGLTASIFYKKRHPEKKIAILEKGALPSGASTRNAGFACFGSVSEILDDLKSMPEKEVFELIEKRYRGLSELRELLGDRGIGYAPTGGFELFRHGKDEMYRECLGSLGYINAELVQYIGKQAFKDAEQQIDPFGFKDVEHMIVNELEGTVDTGKMMKSLIDLAVETGVSIFNGCEVKGYTVSGDKCILDTNIGEIMSARVVVATNGFAKSLIPEADVQPCRGQVLITKPLKDLLPRGCFHHDRGYDYFRTIDDRILLGGGRQLDPEGEQTSEEGLTEAIGNYLESLLKEVILPGREVEIEMRWSGIMGMGSSKSVILKEVEDRVYCAVRLGGMGVALGTSLGRSVAEMLD